MVFTGQIVAGTLSNVWNVWNVEMDGFMFQPSLLQCPSCPPGKVQNWELTLLSFGRRKQEESHARMHVGLMSTAQLQLQLQPR